MRYVLAICAVTAAVTLAVTMDRRSNRVPSGRTHGDVEYKVYATGRVEGSSDQIELRPQLAGAVARVNVRADQVVKAGQVLIELDNDSYTHQISLASAEVQLAQAQRERLINGAHPQEKIAAVADYNGALAEHENAGSAWKRIANLRAENVVSQKKSDDEQARFRTAVARLNAAKARLDHLNAPAREDELRAASAKLAAANSRLALAQAELEKTRLRAPRDGRVLALDIEQGEIAGPLSPRPAVLMVDTDRLQIRAFVEELDAPRLRPGMPAEISVDGLPGKVFAGRVSRLSPHMSRKQLFSDAPNERFDTKVREVWIELQDTTGLFVGLRVDVMIRPQTSPSGSSEPDAPTADPSFGGPVVPPAVTRGEAVQDVDTEGDAAPQKPQSTTGPQFVPTGYRANP